MPAPAGRGREADGARNAALASGGTREWSDCIPSLVPAGGLPDSLRPPHAEPLFTMRNPSTQPKETVRSSEIEALIRTVRGRKVLLDADLAHLYGVTTKVLNQAVRRNEAKFPEDFRFRLTQAETEEQMRSQTVTGSQKHRDPRHLPYAFTEHGAIMAANVLNAPQAVRMSVFVVRAFVQMRALLGGTAELARQLAALDRRLSGRIDGHEVAIVEVLRRILTLIDPPPPPPEPPRRRIGFLAKGR